MCVQNICPFSWEEPTVCRAGASYEPFKRFFVLNVIEQMDRERAWYPGPIHIWLVHVGGKRIFIYLIVRQTV